MDREIKPRKLPPLPRAAQPEKTALPVLESQTAHEFYILPKYQLVAKLLPALVPGTSYGLLSFGKWDLRFVVFHIARLIGPCDVISTTYGLGPQAARGIVAGLKKGIFKSFRFIYDNKVREYKEEAHYMCAENFPVKITSIHAKLTVLKNENYQVLVVGSANWSDSNNKIEYTEIICDPAKAEAVYQLLLRTSEAEASAPSDIYKELGYEL